VRAGMSRFGGGWRCRHGAISSISGHTVLLPCWIYRLSHTAAHRGRSGHTTVVAQLNALEQSHRGPWSTGTRRPPFEQCPALDLDPTGVDGGAERGGTTVERGDGGKRRGRRGDRDGAGAVALWPMAARHASALPLSSAPRQI
jgi:hypothetical protein